MLINWRETLKYTRTTFIISCLVILIGLGAIIYRGGFLYGIDFTGGFQILLEFARPVTPEQVTEARELFERQAEDARITTIGLDDRPGRRGLMITIRGQQLVEQLTARLFNAGRSGDEDVFALIAAERDRYFLSLRVLDDNFRIGSGPEEQIDIARASREMIRSRVQSLVNSALSGGVTRALRERFTPDGEVDLNWASAGEIQNWLIESQVSGFVREFEKLRDSDELNSMDDIYPLLEEFTIPRSDFESYFSVGSSATKLDLVDEVQLDGLREIVYEEYFAGRYGEVADQVISQRNSRGLFESLEQVVNLPSLTGFYTPTLEEKAVVSPFVMVRSEMVSPAIGSDLIGQAALAILISLFGILAYLHIRFELTYSLGAIAAIIHDIVVTVGLLTLFGVEFDVPVIAAVLTVIGYSLNDTIVNFDRVRENRILMGYKASWYEVINRSVYEVLNRTIITSLTTFIAVLFLFLYGGIALQGLSITLLIGVVAGTYSSIFISNVTLLRLQEALRST